MCCVVLCCVDDEDICCPHVGFLFVAFRISNNPVLDNYIPGLWKFCHHSLETTLRNFSCLTVGDNIMVAYNNRKYYIDIIEAKPSQAISIIETDCEVDFAPPLDYKEPEPVRPAAVAPPSTSAGIVIIACRHQHDVTLALETNKM